MTGKRFTILLIAGLLFIVASTLFYKLSNLQSGEPYVPKTEPKLEVYEYHSNSQSGAKEFVCASLLGGAGIKGFREANSMLSLKNVSKVEFGFAEFAAAPVSGIVILFSDEALSMLQAVFDQNAATNFVILIDGKEVAAFGLQVWKSVLEADGEMFIGLDGQGPSDERIKDLAQRLETQRKRIRETKK